MDSAQRLFGTTIGAVFHYDGRMVNLVATRGWSSEALEDARRLYPGPPNPATLNGRVILSCQAQTIADTHADPDYDRTTVQVGQWRRMVGAPMVKDGSPIGAIVVAWGDPGEIPRRQADLLKTFADQAVIAIENVRLFNETKEALEQQTATAEVLQVISSSVSDTQPVFEKILDSCQKLFAGANMGITLVGEDGQVHLNANRSQRPADFDEIRRFYPRPLQDSIQGLAIRRRQVLHYKGLQDEANMPDDLRQLAGRVGDSAMLVAPMLWENRGVGAINMYRDAAVPFTDKEIGLLKTFADQAAIAIQNARLFNETKEALEQQTATAEILQVISRSVADAQPVFDAVVASCQRLFGGLAVNLLLPDGERLFRVARASRDARRWRCGPARLSARSAQRLRRLRTASARDGRGRC